MRRSKLTLGESILILILLSLGAMIAVPVLSHLRSRSLRLGCATNLASLGKAMLLYDPEYDAVFPRAGGPGGSWAARTPNWKASSPTEAYGTTESGRAGRAGVSASLYLLVKYGYSYRKPGPESFVCRADSRTTAWVIDDEPSVPTGFELNDAWDFGPDPPEHVSYSYHMPYSQYRLTTSSKPGLAVAADRNPWMGSPFLKARDFSKFEPNTVRTQTGNSSTHKGDGQNVLYLDTHVDFAKTPNCGLEGDNIYTLWDGDDKHRGRPPTLGSQPANRKDSLLVNDPPTPRQ